MAATLAAFAGGRRSCCSCVVDGHHDRRGEVLSSVGSFPLTFPTMCPNVNRQPPLWAKVENTDSGGGAIPMFPRLPRVLRAQKNAPLTLPAPLVRMPSSHVAISDVRSCVPGAPFVAVLRVLASPSATLKCFSGTSTLGTAAATRSQDFQVRNSFPECNTPLISAHGALSSTPCCRLIEGFGRVRAVTSIVDCSVRSIESIARQHNDEMYKKVSTNSVQQSDATSR